MARKAWTDCRVSREAFTRKKARSEKWRVNKFCALRANNTE